MRRVKEKTVAFKDFMDKSHGTPPGKVGEEEGNVKSEASPDPVEGAPPSGEVTRRDTVSSDDSGRILEVKVLEARGLRARAEKSAPPKDPFIVIKVGRWHKRTSVVKSQNGSSSNPTFNELFRAKTSNFGRRATSIRAMVFDADNDMFNRTARTAQSVISGNATYMPGILHGGGHQFVGRGALLLSEVPGWEMEHADAEGDVTFRQGGAALTKRGSGEIDEANIDQDEFESEASERLPASASNAPVSPKESGENHTKVCWLSLYSRSGRPVGDLKLAVRLLHVDSPESAEIMDDESPRGVGIDVEEYASSIALPREHWEALPASNFSVRGSQYLKDKKKFPSEPTLLKLEAVEIVGVSALENHVAAVSGRGVADVMRRAGHDELDTNRKYMIIHFMVPTDNQSLSYSLTLYYSYDEDEMDDSPGKTLLMKWLRDGDEEFANDRIKMVPHIEKGPFMLKKLIGAPCMLGKYTKLTFFSGPNYREIDIDCRSSSLQSKAVQVVRNVGDMVIDMAFTLQGEEPDELPEQLMATVRLTKLDLSALPVWKKRTITNRSTGNRIGQLDQLEGEEGKMSSPLRGPDTATTVVPKRSQYTRWVIVGFSLLLLVLNLWATLNLHSSMSQELLEIRQSLRILASTTGIRLPISARDEL